MTARPDGRPSGALAPTVEHHRLDEVLPAAPLRPPDHVLTAFNAPSADLERLQGRRQCAWRAGNTVIEPVDHPVEASWLATVFEQRPVPGVRIARPIRSTDGRWVVSGWTAHRFVSGAPAPRFDEARRAGQAVHEAVADVSEPRFLRERSDLRSWADRLAWGEVLDTEGRLGQGHGATVYRELAASRRPVATPNQIVHGELFGNVLFAGTADPAVVDLTAYWRPVGWAIGVLAVDAVARGEAPIELLGDWSDGPDWPQLVRRAMLFRLAVSLAHPRTSANELVVMLSTAERVDRFLR